MQQEQPDLEVIMDENEYKRMMSLLPAYPSRSAEKLRRKMGETQLQFTRADIKFMRDCGIRAD